MGNNATISERRQYYNLPNYCDACWICTRGFGCFGCKYLHRLTRPLQAQVLNLDPVDLAKANAVLSTLSLNVDDLIRLLNFDPTKDLAYLNNCRIKKDLSLSENIAQCVSAAKSGQWDDVFDILDNNEYIVNCIPSERAWSVLHQAAWQNNMEAVIRILHYPKCDPSVLTKQDRNNEYGPNKTADKLTQSIEITELIEESIKHAKEEKEKRIMPTFVRLNEEKELDIQSIFLALASFINILFPQEKQSEKTLLFSSMMRNVFEFIDTGSKWETARLEVGLQLQIVDIKMGFYLATGKEDGNIFQPVLEHKEEFYKRVIKMYSLDKLKLYGSINVSLRSQADKSNPTLGEDLGLAAYGIILNAILFSWKALVPNFSPTYRGVQLSNEVANEYKIGVTFAWLSFTSSTSDEKVAEIFGENSYIFEIDNSDIAAFSAKSIICISAIGDEAESLYPSGAKFRIISRKARKISIKLEHY